VSAHHEVPVCSAHFVTKCARTTLWVARGKPLHTRGKPEVSRGIVLWTTVIIWGQRPSHTGSVGGLYLDTDRNRHLGVDLNGELVETHVLNRFTQYMGAIGLEPGLRSQGICHLGCPD